ncbi:phage integrase SAM-like domain-containing protein [Tenacibaculum maritimum]|uniref:phage integrase SAM-like domain-containing protein n=1 Tax=Tenacibaculum maritimum TaxID=107401 RepID=UPI003875D4DF
MRGKIFLNTTKGKKLKNGACPLICEITWNSNQKPFSLKMPFFTEEWDFEKEEPKKDKRKQLIVRKKKNLLSGLLLKSLDDNSITFDYIKKALTGKLEEETQTNQKEVDFFKYGYNLAEEKRQLVSAKGILKEGNAESYITALNQLRKVKSSVDVSEIDYKLLTDFKNSKLQIGVKKNSVAAYMRALKAIYNECLRVHKLNFEHDPFKGIFTGITTKRNRTKKRNLSLESIKILESFSGNLVKGQQLATNIFLTQFYLGGQDLFDIYYLEKKQVSSNDRIYFVRGKLDDGGYEFDLKIFPKANVILKSFVSRDNFVINGRKDRTGYKSYIKRINSNLELIQNKYNEHIERIEILEGKKYHKLEVLPLGGKITTKVARHTFSTIAKRLYIEPDLLRSLMGHERDDVDTIYKDVYLEEERDKYHKKIIDTTTVKTTTKEIYYYEYLDSDRKRCYKYKYFDTNPKEEELYDETNGRKYSKPKFFNKIHLILK